jgi:hypothetical protein
LLDDRTNVEYALLRIDPLQATSLTCLEADWADPALDAYDKYDENLNRLRGTNP